MTIAYISLSIHAICYPAVKMV